MRHKQSHDEQEAFHHHHGITSGGSYQYPWLVFFSPCRQGDTLIIFDKYHLSSVSGINLPSNNTVCPYHVLIFPSRMPASIENSIKLAVCLHKVFIKCKIDHRSDQCTNFPFRNTGASCRTNLFRTLHFPAPRSPPTSTDRPFPAAPRFTARLYRLSPANKSKIMH